LIVADKAICFSVEKKGNAEEGDEASLALEARARLLLWYIRDVQVRFRKRACLRNIFWWLFHVPCRVRRLLDWGRRLVMRRRAGKLLMNK